MTPLAEIVPYAWWIAGLVLLVLEVVLPGVYLLFLGIAALIVGTAVLLLGGTGGFSWEWQVLAFVILSTLAVLLGRRRVGPKTISGPRPMLNDRAARLVGSVVVLS